MRSWSLVRHERRETVFFFMFLQENHTQCMSAHQHILFPWGEGGIPSASIMKLPVVTKGSITITRFIRSFIIRTFGDLAHYSTYKRYSDQYFRLCLVWKVEKNPQRNAQQHFTRDPLENVSVFSTVFWLYIPCPSPNSRYICQLACEQHTCIFNS